LARECGKTINELLGWQGPLTHRQFQMWQEWVFIVDKNHPSRDNYYMMQCAQVWGGGDLSTYKIPFEEKEVKPLDTSNMNPRQKKMAMLAAAEMEEWKKRAPEVHKYAIAATIKEKRPS
jgi:hypothetical protein